MKFRMEEAKNRANLILLTARKEALESHILTLERQHTALPRGLTRTIVEMELDVLNQQLDEIDWKLELAQAANTIDSD